MPYRKSIISIHIHVCISFVPAGATQVRWNRLSRYLLATAHDGDIKLWDQRKGTAPVQYIAAHLAKVSTDIFIYWCLIQEVLLCFSLFRYFHIITKPSKIQTLSTFYSLNKLIQTVTLLIFIYKVLGSNLNLDTEYSD